MNFLEKAIYASNINRHLEFENEDSIVDAYDAYFEMRKMEELDYIASYQDHELERMGF